MKITQAEISDAKEILELQKIAYLSEAEIYDDFSISPLHQTIEEVEQDFKNNLFLKIVLDDKIIGSIRAYSENGTCFIGKVIVHPSFQNQGLGTSLLDEIEDRFKDVDRFELFTGVRSKKNLYLYNKTGYEIYRTEVLNDKVSLYYLEKLNDSKKKIIG